MSMASSTSLLLLKTASAAAARRATPSLRPRTGNSHRRPSISDPITDHLALSFTAYRNISSTSSALVSNKAFKITPPIKKRPITTTPTLHLDQSADEIIIDWPEQEEQSDPSDVGHNTIGPGVGRHRSRTLESLSLVGKVCVVTGAARGLGNLMARTLVESGANAIALLDLDGPTSESAARDVEDWFIEHGAAVKGEVQAIGIGCDVSNEDHVKAAMQKVVDRFGRIDVLVTAAGIVHNYPATEYPTEKMRQLYGINIDGTFFCARECAKHMLASNRPGTIILIGSMSGSVVNVPQAQTPYNASKAAVKHMASSLAVEWAKKNIRVNSIAPGYMVTSLTRTILDANPELETTWTSLTPMGRLGLPEDIKGAIVFLASDSSAYITGTELRVDGGYCAT
ncbi:MAG: hypothetical protein CYPHOPRED_003971 [Cyphobasidiales sp. Tagirdzhanova-0007]|nr:MAG: hypothetical protein CYPHOPRED_003971 [Cyphobasidiales sp. Tagirdzhanova-0007]